MKSVLRLLPGESCVGTAWFKRMRSSGSTAISIPRSHWRACSPQKRSALSLQPGTAEPARLGDQTHDARPLRARDRVTRECRNEANAQAKRRGMSPFSTRRRPAASPRARSRPGPIAPRPATTAQARATQSAWAAMPMPSPSRPPGSAMSGFFVWNIACTARTTPSGSPAKKSVAPFSMICHESRSDSAAGALHPRDDERHLVTVPVVHPSEHGPESSRDGASRRVPDIGRLAARRCRSLSRPRLSSLAALARAGPDAKGHQLAQPGRLLYLGSPPADTAAARPSVSMWPAGLDRMECRPSGPGCRRGRSPARVVG